METTCPIPAEYLDAPFLDDGRPEVSRTRLSRTPVSGTILNRVTWKSIDFAKFQDDSALPLWRILLPEHPIPCVAVKLQRLEGRIEEIREPLRLAGRKIHWPTWSTADGDGNVWVNPISEAQTRLIEWGLSAPESGRGYLKTGFSIVWEDRREIPVRVGGPWSYSGRFDLNRGGTDGERNFRDSLLSRLLYHAGLHCPRGHDLGVYYQNIRQYPQRADLCRFLLANAEL